ncbi:UbiD family decarboxylase [Propionicicella superfundia]|uniref:UbiD family decarboxylase n=1 Tax=Propionicicella superfundia TaxID=348582 RepID=UPI000426FDD1|nr:UbiD family decarboxylase [Propionicicella superfundia]
MAASTGHDLPSYLAYLGTHDGELVVIDRPVGLGPEIAAVTKALEPLGAPAVLFRAVSGSPFPVLMGTFGSRRRLAQSVGVGVDALLDHVLALPRGPLGDVEQVVGAPVQHVVRTGDDVDLDALPFAVHSRDDAGRYITSGVVIARDPATGAINTGMYRMMITDRRHVTVNAAPDHDLGRIFARARATGETVPIAIVIGHHPAYLMASQVKNPVSIDTHRLAAALLGSPLRVVDGLTVDLPIPADAEVVVEGFVDPGQSVSEGPFGEFSYYYGATTAPLCRVTAVSTKEFPIFLDLHPTHREHLCLWLYPGREARLLDRVRQSVPGVRSVRVPFHSGGLGAFVAIDKTHEGDGKQAILAALAADHFLKHVVVVDADDIDIFDDARVLWAVNVRSQAADDLVVVEGARGMKMDPSAVRLLRDTGPDYVSSKLGIDATRRLSPSFPIAADLPPRGFEGIDPLSYLDDRQQALFGRRSAYRRAVAE